MRSPTCRSTKSERFKSMSLTNDERVYKAIKLLVEGLAPFVDRMCRARFGDNWPDAVQRTNQGGSSHKVNPRDLLFLLNVMLDKWKQIFSKGLSPKDRNYIFELRSVRNSLFHIERFSTDDTLRALDSAKLLLKAVAADNQATQVDELYQDLLRQKFDQQPQGTRHQAAVAPSNDDGAKLTDYSNKPLDSGVGKVVGKRPIGYTLFGDYKPWRSGIGMWVDVVEQVYSRHKHDFLGRVDKLRLTPGSRRVLISGNPQSINRSKRTRAPGIYIEYSLTQTECVNLAYQLLDLFGYPPSDLLFNDDRAKQPAYSGKPANPDVSRGVDDQPIGYTLFGVYKPWRSGIGMWVDVVEQVYSRHKHDFLGRADKPRLTPGSRRVLISSDRQSINRSKRTKAPGIYIEYSLTQAECVKLAYQLLELFEHPAFDLVFHWD